MRRFSRTTGGGPIASIALLAVAGATAAALLAPAVAAQAAGVPTRVPVLPQVDLPHSYYWREMYVPQPTTGPSAAAFSPDGREVVYSMAGSLWVQTVGADHTREISHGPGYDLQPDWSSDGRWIVFVRSSAGAMELWRLQPDSGREQQLTHGGAVNLEPRFAPGGQRLAFVSTRDTGHFNLYIADLDDAGLRQVRSLVPPRSSKIDRYYYSAFDHAINPSFSPDGQRVYYVGNPEVAWGSGDIWSVSSSDPADRQRVLVEETTWAARPEPSPDGKRILFSSYHGRQWHQLWLTTPTGLSPLPLTFGDFDRRNARWSPDGRRILYVSNERSDISNARGDGTHDDVPGLASTATGNTSLWVQDVVGGARVAIRARQRHYQRVMAELQLTLHDEHGAPLAARVSVRGADRRYYAPDDAWLHGDDHVLRVGAQDQETRYFHCHERCSVTLPAGSAQVTVMNGFERVAQTRSITMPSQGMDLPVKLMPLALPERFGAHTSADLHVHMNYGGHYRQTAQGLAAQAQAEDLDVVYNLIVNKEQRITDIAEFTPAARQIGTTTLFQGQEFHTSYWGHLGLLHPGERLLLPDFSGYRHTALASPWPHNGIVAELAHRQNALVGYVHPYDWPIDPATEKTLTHALPVDVAHGRVDFIEVVSFADHRATAGVWYRLLNLGFRLAAGAGSDAMSNYASLRGPVGLNRVYLATGERTPAALRTALATGHSFVTNGPLLGLRVDGHAPGDTLRLRGGKRRVRIDAAVRSIVPLTDIELVFNGKVIKRLRADRSGRSADFDGEIPVTGSGWLLLRALNSVAQELVQDLYPYATTNPVWIDAGAPPAPAREDARYFVRWIDRIIESAAARADFNTDEERERTLDYLRSARAIYESKANAN